MSVVFVWVCVVMLVVGGGGGGGWPGEILVVGRGPGA